MNYKDRQIGGINGVVTIRTICKSTGRILDEFKDNNVVTLDGMEHLWTRAESNAITSDYTLQHFSLGSDYGAAEGGDWNIFAPKPAQNNYTDVNQFVIYDDDPVNTVFEYPSENELQVGTLLDGEYILDTYSPSQVTVRYNSATIRFGDGTVFSYKRFPVRSISRLVDVQILWTFTLVDSALFDCGDIEPPVIEPEPDHSLGISVYAGYWGDNTIHKLDDNAVMLWIYDGHTDWVNDIKVDENYVFSVSRDKSIHILDNTNGSPYNIIHNAHSDVINRVMIDGDRIVTASNDQTVKKWDYVNGAEEWSFTPTNVTAKSDAMAVVKSELQDTYFVAYRDGRIFELQATDGKEVQVIDLGYEIVEIETTLDNDLLVSIFDDTPNGYAYAVIRYSLQFNNIQLVIEDYNDYSFRVLFDKTGNDDTPDFFIGSDDKHVRRYDRIGDLQWEFDRTLDIIRGMALDQFGYIYTGSLDETVRKVSPNGNQVWAYTGNENPASCIAVSVNPET